MLWGAPLLLSDVSLVYCKIGYFTNDFVELTIQWLMVAVAGERFFVVYFPFSAKRLILRISVAYCVSALLFSAFITLPDLLIEEMLLGECVFSSVSLTRSETFFIVRHIALQRFVPQLLIVLFNGLVLYALFQRMSSTKRLNATQVQANSRSSLKITLGLVTVSSLHMVLYAQCGLFCFISFFDWTEENSLLIDQGKFITGALYIWAYSINFFVYYMTNNAFKANVWKCITPKLCFKNRKKLNFFY